MTYFLKFTRMPVWTFLYLLMGIALWLIWKSTATERHKKNAALVFALQLFLNFWWSVFFFKFESPIMALADIILMILFIVITIFSFIKISRIAAWLLLPYLAWVSFAAVLNYKIWIMNL